MTTIQFLKLAFRGPWTIVAGPDGCVPVEDEGVVGGEVNGLFDKPVANIVKLLCRTNEIRY